MSNFVQYTIENELLYQAIQSHFNDGIPWEETEYIQQALEQLKEGKTSDTWRAVVKSEADLWERCAQLDELYEQITENGYKRKREIFNAESNDPMGYYPRTFKYTIDEVMVDRARDGEPLLVDGKHRLYLAKTVNIDKIPVIIAVRHFKTVQDNTN